MKRIIKCLTSLLLSCFLAFSGIAGSYQTVQAAEVVAGYTAGQILESILLSFGVSIFTTEMIQNGSDASWWDTDGSAALQPYYDDLEQAYEEQRFKVINGGGGSDPDPSPTPAAGTTPIPFPTTVPVAGDIPTFQELVAPALAGTAAFINMTQGAWECMGKAVSSLWDKIIGAGATSDDCDYSKLDDSNYKNAAIDGMTRVGKAYSLSRYGSSGTEHYTDLYINNSDNVICAVFWRVDGSTYIYPVTSSYNKVNFILYITSYYYSNYSLKTGLNVEYRYGGDLPSLSSGDIWSFNLPLYDITGRADLNSPAALKEYIEGTLPKKEAKEEIWVHPDLEDTYKNNGKLEYPQQAQQPLKIPSGDQLAETVKKLNPEINTDYTPELAPNYIQELIEKLQTSSSTDPDPEPTVAPNPNPSPDTGTDTDVDVKPTSAPDPTQAPDSSEEDIDPKNYTVDLQKIFPFCIPFDLIHLLDVLDADPEAPYFEIPIDLEADNPFTGKKIVDYHTKIVIDMSDYEQPIKVIRIFEVMFFILALLLITRDQMIKG